MNDVDRSITDYAGYDLSFGDGKVGLFSYELGQVSGDGGGKIVCSWERARKIILRQRRTPPKIISYYTVDTPYEDMAAELASSLDALDMPYEMKPYASRGSWVANTCLKSECILQFWQESDGPICWLDADSTVARPPWFLFDSPFDFAVVRKKGWHIMSGMILLNKTPAVEAMLLEWTALCKAHPYVWDQVLLTYAWYRTARKMPVNTMWLPVDIFDIPLRSDTLKERLKVFRKRWFYGFHRRSLPKFFMQKQASRSHKKALNDAPVHIEIGTSSISEDFRRALIAGDFSRDFTIEDVLPAIATMRAQA